MSDSTEFLVKTNNDVDAWMEEFYVDGKKAPFRLYCQWAWQEQERRHRAIEADLIKALQDSSKELRLMIDKHNQRDPDDGSYAYDYQTVFEADQAIAKALTP
jgi:hypothetical protein